MAKRLDVQIELKPEVGVVGLHCRSARARQWAMNVLDNGLWKVASRVGDYLYVAMGSKDEFFSLMDEEGMGWDFA